MRINMKLYVTDEDSNWREVSDTPRQLPRGEGVREEGDLV